MCLTLQPARAIRSSGGAATRSCRIVTDRPPLAQTAAAAPAADLITSLPGFAKMPAFNSYSGYLTVPGPFKQVRRWRRPACGAVAAPRIAADLTPPPSAATIDAVHVAQDPLPVPGEPGQPGQ